VNSGDGLEGAVCAEMVRIGCAGFASVEIAPWRRPRWPERRHADLRAVAKVRADQASESTGARVSVANIEDDAAIGPFSRQISAAAYGPEQSADQDDVIVDDHPQGMHRHRF